MRTSTRWVRYRSPDNQVGFGSLVGDQIQEHSGELFDSPKPTGRTMAAADVQLLNPCQPSKIVALWNNYHALAAKIGKAPPNHPLFLIKSPSSVIGPNEPIRRPASYTGKIVYEGELGVVIGRRASNVSLEQAREVIFGYTCTNDVTASDLLGENADFAQWTRAKSFDTFGCVGPAIATAIDLGSAHVVTRMDGVERQNYPLSDLIFAPERLVSLLSQDLTLLPGDIISVGTSLGVGAMKEGATLQVSIEGIGTLTNSFR